jgi:hypothetical protein
MGDHFPATTYGTKAGFEQRGCSASTLKLGALRVARRGRRARVRVLCTSYEATCTGRVVLRRGRRLIARKRFTVPSGRSSAVTLRISRKARKRLRRARRLAVRAVATTPTGVPVSASRRYRLKRR